MSEFYTVQIKTATIAEFVSVDEAEIKKVMIGNSAVVVVNHSNLDIVHTELACYEENGEFYIQNENSERVCTLDVGIQSIDSDDSTWYDSDLECNGQLSEEYYQWSINGVWSDKINLTDTLKRNINNEIEGFIGMTNDKK